MTDQFLSVQQHITRASPGDDLIDIATIGFSLDPLTGFYSMQAVDMDTGEVHSIISSGLYLQIWGLTTSVDWPVTGIGIANDFPMPSRTLRLQLQLITGLGTVADVYNLIPINLVPPMQVQVSLNGFPVSGATVEIIPKDPNLAFQQKVSVSYNTDTNGIAQIQMTGVIAQFQKAGALISAYIPASDFFVYQDNAPVGAGIFYNLNLKPYNPAAPPLFQLTLHTDNPVTPLLAQIGGLIGTPTGFKLVGLQANGNDLLMGLQPLPMSPEFNWQALLTFVLVVGLIIVLVTVIGWTFQQVSNIGTNIIKPLAPGLNTALIAFSVAAVAGVGLVVYSFASSPEGRAQVRHATLSGARSARHAAGRAAPHIVRAGSRAAHTAVSGSSALSRAISKAYQSGKKS